MDRDIRYRQATLYFYSGTGNSYRVATWLTEAAADRGAAVSLRPITAADPAEVGVGEQALLGLCMPTHGFTAPWAMVRFALRLPRRRGTHAVAVATRAGVKIGSFYAPGFEGTATLLVAAILALKGYRVRGIAGIDMPSNWTALHPGCALQTAHEICERARQTTDRFAAIVLSGRSCFDGWIVPLLGLALLPVSLAYLLLGRFFLAKLFFPSDRCTGCGLCARHCPNDAITMRAGRPYWTFRCESCMRCMAYCPTEAVEVSHLLGVAAYTLAAAFPLAWLADRHPVLSFLTGMSWVVESIGALAVLALVYPLFWLSLRVKWIHWLSSRLTLTRYYRRYHQPETILPDLKAD